MRQSSDGDVGEALLANGGNVARTQLPGAQNHFTTPGVAQPMYVDWVADRLE